MKIGRMLSNIGIIGRLGWGHDGWKPPQGRMKAMVISGPDPLGNAVR